MSSEAFCDRISDDWLWRERELRDIDRRLLKDKSELAVKTALLISYSHWEGHFKVGAHELLGFMMEGVRRKIFKWTQFNSDVRQRILFCSLRRSNIANQRHETFIHYLNCLSDERYQAALEAKDEIIMVDDNLSSLKAETICRNLGVDYSWCALKKVIIDERVLEHRNAIAHGSRRLRSGDEIDLSKRELLESVDEMRGLIRESRGRFTNAIVNRSFLM